MIRALHLTLGKLFAAVLLTLCLGVQVLEATGRWDRTLQDTSDEAIIVTVVLCIGAGIAVARARRAHVSLSAVRAPIVVVRTARRQRRPSRPPAALCASPPLSLRI